MRETKTPVLASHGRPVPDDAGWAGLPRGAAGGNPTGSMVRIIAPSEPAADPAHRSGGGRRVGSLTKPEFAVLDALRDGVPQTQRQLAARTGLSLGYVNRAARRLRTAGLLGEETLTPAGWDALEPYRVTGAIILAAGPASRFVLGSRERPKGLLLVRGEVLIERQIRQLRQAGIPDIVVVVGYRQEQYFYLEDAFGVRIVVNPDYAHRDNSSSLRAAEAFLDNSYICCCDHYFTSNVFEPYVYQSYHAACWQDGPSEEWGVQTSPSGRITTAAPGATDTWIMTGQAYWDRAFSQRFKAILDKVYDTPATAPKTWEAIFAEHIDQLPLHLRNYPAGSIADFDDLDDLRAFDPGFVVNIDSAILDNICTTLACARTDLADFTPITTGLTNLSFRFRVGGHEYVYRHPGAATLGPIDRAAEAQAEAVASRLGLDDTYIHLDPVAGWKVSRYVDGAEAFDHRDPAHRRAALRAIRTLHTCGETIDGTFDLFEEATTLKRRLLRDSGLGGRGRLDFPDFAILDERAARLNRCCQSDDVRPVLCHNDFYAPNILIAGERVALIDWEYAGMGDPAGDLGTFICCSDATDDEALDVIATYYGRPPTPAELRHAIAYVGLAAYYWWLWALHKDACGEPVGHWTYRWYRCAADYGRRALALYGPDEDGPGPASRPIGAAVAGLRRVR
ncbi:MAG: phosphotransferase [Actinomycetia bacterium]|nr:phosphotransferase [Actinomycetes bacterium]